MSINDLPTYTVAYKVEQSVHRLDVKGETRVVLKLHDHDSLRREWIKWIKSQTLIR